ncbi:vasotocin-neurophysin VT 1-like [Denticeps clupeoides]|uniref:vasotocin-neurophysin VT 1-like n=1 Tax=Denticeps clupeoides TaxID=299321 RepID=UPI0010A4E585|nr:vasotocin-neurophysin VT 1-like [Denticeps clupeoides]
MQYSALPLLALLALLSLSSACYIQNCPRGGKRSSREQPLRQCMACGPGDQGRCFGPSICCGEVMGCYVGSPETARCMEEDYLPSPCETGGKACGSEDGYCAAPGICCDAEGCVLDTDCEEEGKRRPLAEQNMTLMGGSPGEILLRLLHTGSRARNRY